MQWLKKHQQQSRFNNSRIIYLLSIILSLALLLLNCFLLCSSIAILDHSETLIKNMIIESLILKAKSLQLKRNSKMIKIKFKKNMQKKDSNYSRNILDIDLEEIDHRNSHNYHFIEYWLAKVLPSDLQQKVNIK